MRFLAWCAFAVCMVVFGIYAPVWLTAAVCAAGCVGFLMRYRPKPRRRPVVSLYDKELPPPKHGPDGDYEWRQYHDLKEDEDASDRPPQPKSESH